MAPTVIAEVQQLSFSELLCHLAAAHEREIIELQTEIKQLRGNNDDAASSGEMSASGSGSGVLEMSAFPSRQPTLASHEDYEPLPEDTEACLTEKSEELPIAVPAGEVQAPCPTQRQQARAGLKRTGPDAKALACALQVAQSLGLGAISEDHVHEFEVEAQLLFSEAARTRTEDDSASPEASAKFDSEAGTLSVSPDPPRVKQFAQSCVTEFPSSLAVTQTPMPNNPSLLLASPLDDDEPLPEEDKSVLQSGNAAEASRFLRERRAYSGEASQKNSLKNNSQLHYEWSIVSEKTGDAASTLNMTVSPGIGLDSGLGLSSAIWVEATDDPKNRQPTSPSQAIGNVSTARERIESSELANSRRDHEDSKLKHRQDSGLEDILINDESDLDGHEARFLDMPRERLSSTLPELEQTLVTSGPTVEL